MNEQKLEKKTLEPRAYSDPIHGLEYRQQLLEQWRLQDMLGGGIGGMIVRGNHECGSATMPNAYPPLASGNNTQCAKCGQWFASGGGRWTTCAMCRD